jgi:hypothetical protein
MPQAVAFSQERTDDILLPVRHHEIPAAVWNLRFVEDCVLCGVQARPIRFVDVRYPALAVRVERLSLKFPQPGIRIIEPRQIPVVRPQNLPDGPQDFMIRSSVSAISDGVVATAMPASLNAAIFAAAVPFPPLTMAPA